MNEGDEPIERDEGLIAVEARIRASIPDKFTQYRMRRAWRASLETALNLPPVKRAEEETHMAVTTKEPMAAVDVDELKGMVRELAAGVPRPVLLHELVDAVVRALAPQDAAAIVAATVERWVLSTSEPVREVAAGVRLYGPAAKADDADAWDDFEM